MGASEPPFLLLRQLDSRGTWSHDDHKCPQTLPGVPWGQDCPGKELLDLKTWLTFWCFSSAGSLRSWNTPGRLLSMTG